MSTPGLVAWSYSRLSAWETCPRKFWHVSVAKDLKEEESDAMAEGTRTHKAFELRLRNGTPLPLHLRQLEPVLAKIDGAPGEKSIEQQIALDRNWQSTSWFSKDAWLRVKSDLTQLNGPYAVCWDWKTGKPGSDFTQLQLNAAVTFHLAPEVQDITMAFVWTKTNAVTSAKINRSQVADIWSNLLPRVAKYQAAHEQDNFPPKPNWFCKGCVVKSCQYWEAKPPRR